MAPKKSKKSKKSGRLRQKASIVISTSSTGTPKWKQSPIDLHRSFTWTQKFPPLFLSGYDLNEGTATMTNTGKTVRIELNDRILPSIRCGPLNEDEFTFANVEFRWGPNDSWGSEHSIDNAWYSMEAQIMHWNTRYKSIEECYKKSNGIAILSYFLQVVGCPNTPDNPAFSRITNYLEQIKKMGTSTNIPPDCLHWILEACVFSGYYTYSGSLTTPPYHECVIWIVIPYSIKISSRQVEAFRCIYNYKWEHIKMNLRPKQKLHGRQILYAIDCSAN